jgi:glycerol-3-phosphate dehydrogenase (NAD+)
MNLHSLLHVMWLQCWCSAAQARIAEGHRVQADADYFNEHQCSPTYLKDVKLPACVKASCDPPSALSVATHLIHAVPCQYSRKYLEGVAPLIPPGVPVVCTSKGIEAGTLAMMNDILVDTLGADRNYAFLSGPSFAREIATGLATAVVVASKSTEFSNEVAEMFSCETFRVFTTKDVAGVEIGGAVKNVIAIAAGMCEGLGLGTNAMAGLVTRGCLEMQTLAKAIGASPVTLMGLSGVGDTFGTCFGPLSRNRQLGFRLGQGEALEEILASSTEVAEGYATSLSLVDFLLEKLPRSYRMDLKFPILFGVAAVLKGQNTPDNGMRELMMLPIRTEVFDYRENSVQARVERKRRAALRKDN